MKELPTRYDPKTVEEALYNAWEKEGLFKAKTDTGKRSYCIVIPPPNVTGILHMGHALNNTIQDILIRWKRMQGFESLWVPGTDHAGIATQNVVERALAKQGIKRTDLSREEFIGKVWTWKDEYGNTIIKQLKKLGSSCDWDRTRFTMDEGLSRAVREVFVRLYREGLIYKDDFLINWCPRCGTALSDEEAEHKDVNGMLYYIKYPVKGRERLDKENEDYVIVATTRPETMLGDVAIAVNPNDPRYAGLRGKTLILPIAKRELKIIFDENVDPEFGTGALKVTPAHDPVDFELGIKHGLARVNVMNGDGTMNSNGEDYEGMDRFECRDAIVEDLKDRKLFVKTEDHRHAVGHCYRCHTMVEPRLSNQWFVRMKPLAKEGIEVVRTGKIKFYPPRWTKVYLNWMENIRDWCISRQILWGHRIPVWYCKDCLKYHDIRDVKVTDPGMKGVFVRAENEGAVVCPSCGGSHVEQDPDVLDTWFSSWLWPISTLGWPEETRELRTFYPTHALVTAQEIIFFWVARMIMAGLKFRGDIPFSDVYIHGTVRDSTGTKMSKSLGNVIDPLDVIGEVGSDALRYSIISITSQGQDVFLSKEKFEFGRNFANKLWNASRYVLMNTDEARVNCAIMNEKNTLADRWILSSLNETISGATESLGAYRFNEAASILYDFIWHKYCDWYLELSKLAGDKANTENILIFVLNSILRLLHPFMPFITEEIWQKLPSKSSKWIMTAEWPVADTSFADKASQDNMEKLIALITSIRNIRSFWNIDNKVTVNVFLQMSGDEDASMIGESKFYIEKLAKCAVKSAGKDIVRPERSVANLVGGIRIFVPLGDAIDVEKETARIKKKKEELEKYVVSLSRKLDNKEFIDRAPEDIVRKEKEKKERFERELRELAENLKALTD